MRLAFCANAFNPFDTTILNGKDWFHIQHGAKKTLRAANASAAMKKLQGIHCKENTSVFVRLLSQGKGFLEARASFQSARHCKSLKTEGHGNRLAIHDKIGRASCR